MIKLTKIRKEDLEPDRSYWVKEASMILTGKQLSVMFGESSSLTVFQFKTAEEKYNELQNGQDTDGSDGFDSDVSEGCE